MTTYIIHGALATTQMRLDGGEFTVYEIGSDKRFQSVAQFLQEKITGQPESEEIHLDSFEVNGDGWHIGEYTRFKILSGEEKEITPVDVTTKIELQ